MRTLVREILDDKNEDANATWSNSQINNQITVAQAMTTKMLAKNSYVPLLKSTDLTLTGGKSSLPVHEKIISVQVVTGETNFENIIRGDAHSSKTLTNVSGNIRVIYIAKDEPVTVDAYTITYATIDLNDPLVDQFCAATASLFLKAQEAENNPVLREQLMLLEKAIIGSVSPEVRSSKSPNPKIINNYKYFINHVDNSLGVYL